jgi:hypothetical protein
LVLPINQTELSPQQTGFTMKPNEGESSELIVWQQEEI